MKNRNKNKMKKLIVLLENIKFKSLNISFSKQIVLVWAILWIISLMFPWIIDNQNDITWNSFNSLAWNIGYLLILIYTLPILLILSNSYKEKIKLYWDLNFRTHFIIINSWLISISFSIILLSFAIWINWISQGITHWNWAVMSMTSWLIILIWWLIIRKEFKKTNSEIILEKLTYEREKQKEKDNMKLPF